MARIAAVLVVAAAAALAPPAAAHTLSKSTARKEAAKTGAQMARDLGGKPAYQCERVSAHRVDCQVSLVTLDESACVSVVRVSIRRGSSKPRRRVLSGPDCRPPELPEVLGR